MKKGLIFIGEAETGKSRTARLIRNFYGDKAVYLDGRQFNPKGFEFYFKSCSSETKVVIIDELLKADYLMSFLEVVSEGIISVHVQGKEPFEIEIDKLILIFSSDVRKEDLPQGASFTRRFDVIEFSNVEIEKLYSDTDLILVDDVLKAFGFDRLFSVLKTDR